MNLFRDDSCYVTGLYDVCTMYVCMYVHITPILSLLFYLSPTWILMTPNSPPSSFSSSRQVKNERARESSAISQHAGSSFVRGSLPSLSIPSPSHSMEDSLEPIVCFLFFSYYTYILPKFSCNVPYSIYHFHSRSWSH